MKSPKPPSILFVELAIVASVAAALLPMPGIRSGRAAQDGIAGYDTPRMPSDDQLRIGPYSNFNNPRLAGPEDPVEVMIELEDPPAIDAFMRAQEGGASFAGRAAPQAIAAAQARIERIAQAQARLSGILTGSRFKARIMGRVQRVYNGLAVHVASGRLSELQALPGVKAVHFPELIYPATETSVPFIGAHRAWDPTLAGAGYTGEGVTIAVIDSGIDYTHANLGGSGSVTIYNSNNPGVAGDVADFPNIKVIGGVDLVGDSYNAADPNNSTPTPDPDPVDCRSNGHGTAVAGIAAGSGVNLDGTPYTGNYDQNVNFSSFRIGPGVAPKANLYAIKVFGCNALNATSNTVVTQAIERALDPNQDGDFSDRARVVILPGGGPFSTLPNSPVIAAINNGALLNVIYVGAAGNGGDTYLAAGGPALAEGALAVAATADMVEPNGGHAVNVSLRPGDITTQLGLANTFAPFSSYGGVYTFTSRGPRNTGSIKPDIAAPGVNIGSARAGSGDDFYYFSGTSAAAPHVAGVAALLAQKYPGATTRQIYDIVRSTGTDVYSGANSAPPEVGPGLVGGGGVNAEAAITTFASVNTSQTGAGTNLHGAFLSLDDIISNRVGFSWNFSATTTYNATLHNLASIPGVNPAIPNPTGTVPPNSIFNIEYLLSSNPAAFKRQCAPWVSPTQANNPRHCIPEAAGKVRIDPGAGYRAIAAPFTFYARPFSQMVTEQTSINLANPTGTFTLDLTGQGVNNGPTLPQDWRSFVSPFELQWIDPNDALTPPDLDHFDLQHVGIRKVGDRLIFGLSTHGDWKSTNELRFNVFIDLDRDGEDDFHLFNTSFPNAQGAPSDVPITRLFNINTQTFAPQTFFVNSFSPATLDSALYYTNVLTLPVSEAAFGGPIQKFDYTVKTSFGNVVIDESARLTYDAANPGLDFGSSTMFNDLPGTTIQVNYNRNSFRAANPEGALLLHHFNVNFGRAQILRANEGLEGDLDNDGDVDGADFVKWRASFGGDAEVRLGNEFQRYDCANRDSLGDGKIGISDVSQWRRYEADLDPLKQAGGPLAPASQSPSGATAAPSPGAKKTASQSRTLRVAGASFTQGQANTLGVEIDALGGENGFSFSLDFDPAALSFVSAEAGSDAPAGSLLIVNDKQVAEGRLGFALVLPAGQGLVAGTRRVARVNFNIAAGGTAPVTQIGFGDNPIGRGVANINADEVAAAYAGAEIALIRLAAHVSAASFASAPVASESIVAAFGVALATGTVAAATVPLPTTLAGTTVTVRDSAGVERPGSLFFVSAGQVNYAIPAGTAPGQATITIRSGDGAVSTGDVMIEAVAPGLFAANSAGQGVAAAQVLRVKGDGTQVIEPVAIFDEASGQFIAAPIDLGPAEEQVFLILYGTGMRFGSGLSGVQLMAGGTSLETLFLGAQGGFVGLDQLNARLARSLAGRGEINIELVIDGRQANVVTINIQ